MFLIGCQLYSHDIVRMKKLTNSSITTSNNIDLALQVYFFVFCTNYIGVVYIPCEKNIKSSYDDLDEDVNLTIYAAQ